MSLNTIVGAVLLACLVAAPSAVAQFGAVKGCSKECNPQEINGGTVKTGAEPVNVILYSHWEDVLNQAPLNSQMPDPSFEKNLNRGFVTPVLDTWALPVVGPVDPNFHFRNNEFIMYSSAGFVEYPSDGSWRTHQEPGLAADIHIASKEIKVYWYMSSHAVPTMDSSQGAGATAKVGVMPQVAIYGHIETGRFKWNFLKHPENLIAQTPGHGDPTMAPVSGARRVNLITAPGQDDVYEFEIQMDVKTPLIPQGEASGGFLVYLNPYQLSYGDAPKDNQVAQEQWRARVGPSFLPRIILPTVNIMETRAASLSTFENRMFVRWSFVSALGSYDLTDSSLVLENIGSTKIDVTPQSKQTEFIILKRSVDHDGHFKPVNATWAIDYVNYPLEDGDYELKASILNLQKTYRLEQKFQFKIVNGEPDPATVPPIGVSRPRTGGPGSGAQSTGGDGPGIPGFEGMTAAVGVAMVAFVVARRRRE